MTRIDNPSWFTTQQIDSNLYLTTENHFFEGNRSNIWLIRGAARDLIIDCGLGVCNLKKHFENLQLLNRDRECIVLCTHSHFDHSGGAIHFENDSQIFIHQADYDGLRSGRQVETLNYVKPTHFYQQPYENFSTCQYRVHPTKCDPIMDGHRIDLGAGDEVIVLHVPGHTHGSIVCYYPKEKSLFTGDFVYDCGLGGDLLDWLPTSSVREYLRSANYMIDWLQEHDIDKIYPGHFRILNDKNRVRELLEQYINSKDDCCSSHLTASCLQTLTSGFFKLGCFRCCPC
jgi:glyoxylase-like metal-dependent hydrolase (beta-lactamase superfamily II)